VRSAMRLLGAGGPALDAAAGSGRGGSAGESGVSAASSFLSGGVLLDPPRLGRVAGPEGAAHALRARQLRGADDAVALPLAGGRRLGIRAPAGHGGDR
jgi:hypothetical protein